MTCTNPATCECDKGTLDVSPGMCRCGRHWLDDGSVTLTEQDGGKHSKYVCIYHPRSEQAEELEC